MAEANSQARSEFFQILWLDERSHSEHASWLLRWVERDFTVCWRHAIKRGACFWKQELVLQNDQLILSGRLIVEIQSTSYFRVPIIAKQKKSR